MCRRISPILDEISEGRGDVCFVKLNVDENQKTTISYKIGSIPTIIRFEDGRVTRQVVGALPKNQLASQLGL